MYKEKIFIIFINYFYKVIQMYYFEIRIKNF